METLDRRQSFQTVAWFRDAHVRGLLNLDPPYQRRSVWNEEYRQFFVETLLLRYPAPAIFVHEQITLDGAATYAIVDGKQRLTTIFDFASGNFPISKNSKLDSYRGMFFTDLPDEVRQNFWKYQFSVEYLPTTNGAILTEIFDRINRNVARLTPQELRHARFNGLFASEAENMAEHLAEELPEGFPNIASASRRQMRDVEFAAQLLLYAEMGEPQSFSQEQLDVAYSDRDSEWNSQARTVKTFKAVVSELSKILPEVSVRRARNQADFYSIFGSVMELKQLKDAPSPSVIAARLNEFLEIVGDESARSTNADADAYYEAARSASNDLRQRAGRAQVLKRQLLMR